MVTTWPAATPGLDPVPVRVPPLELPVRVNSAAPALRSSSRMLPSPRTTGFPDSVPPRWVKRLSIKLKAPLLVTLPPLLTK